MKRPWNRFSTHKVLGTVFALLLSVSVRVSAKTKTDRTTAQVDKVFADLANTGSPGCALGVFRDGRIIYAKGYGLASVELNSPITPQTVFDIGSTSKQFTAASIMLLEQQGKLSINDDVRKYIPELPDYTKNGGPEITILNLLNHTSGLRDYLGLLQLSGVSADSVTTDDDALALIIRQKNLQFAPGSDWAYSNTGYFLLSVIVKRVSGLTLRDFASQNIFQPLGMAHTSFRNDHTMLIPNRALAYDPGDKSGYKLDVSYYEQLGDGAVHTSVEDLAKWDDNFYSGNGAWKVVIPKLQERGKLDSGKVLEYAKGLFILDYRGLHAVRHGGAWGGYRAELLRFPDEHFSVSCLCNLANANPGKRADQVAEIYIGQLMKPDKGAPSAARDNKASTGMALTSAQIDALTGKYRDPAKGTMAQISVMDGKLQLEIYGGTFGLRALSATRFVPINLPNDAQITFVLGGKPTDRVMKISGDEMMAATYQNVPELSLSTDELTTYAGDYKSNELGIIYRLRLVEGKLNLVAVLDSSGIPRTGMSMPNVLLPTVVDEFEISNQASTVQFLKNAGREVSGFNLDPGGIGGIEFSRTTGLEGSPH
jgi:CubicO group peptidase (beta-lactamase class C family)